MHFQTSKMSTKQKPTKIYLMDSLSGVDFIKVISTFGLLNMLCISTSKQLFFPCCLLVEIVGDAVLTVPVLSAERIDYK